MKPIITPYRQITILLFCLSGLLGACHKKESAEIPINSDDQPIDYRAAMRSFVIGISNYTRSIDENFILIPQNGQELCSLNGATDGPLALDYLSAIDGQGREELFFGYDNQDDVATPIEETEFWLPYLQRMEDAGIRVLVTDYCSSPSHVDASYAASSNENFISFAANARDLNTIPTYPLEPTDVNDDDILLLSDARNFLYLINPDQFTSKQEFLQSIAATNYDLIIMDAYFEDEPITSEDLDQIRYKANGGQRLLIAYMSIGEAEDYRPYWDPTWSFNPPLWLGATNPDWPGNYKVKYWDPLWQTYIYGQDGSYAHQLITSGFDGTYLDIIDAYEYYEEN
jgi:cysteinyl-tRNA synthetase, unknown class